MPPTRARKAASKRELPVRVRMATNKQCQRCGWIFSRSHGLTRHDGTTRCAGLSKTSVGKHVCPTCRDEGKDNPFSTNRKDKLWGEYGHHMRRHGTAYPNVGNDPPHSTSSHDDRGQNEDESSAAAAYRARPQMPPPNVISQDTTPHANHNIFIAASPQTSANQRFLWAPQIIGYETILGDSSYPGVGQRAYSERNRAPTSSIPNALVQDLTDAGMSMAYAIETNECEYPDQASGLVLSRELSSDWYLDYQQPDSNFLLGLDNTQNFIPDHLNANESMSRHVRQYIPNGGSNGDKGNGKTVDQAPPVTESGAPSYFGYPTHNTSSWGTMAPITAERFGCDLHESIDTTNTPPFFPSGVHAMHFLYDANYGIRPEPDGGEHVLAALHLVGVGPSDSTASFRGNMHHFSDLGSNIAGTEISDTDTRLGSEPNPRHNVPGQPQQGYPLLMRNWILQPPASEPYMGAKF